MSLGEWSIGEFAISDEAPASAPVVTDDLGWLAPFTHKPHRAAPRRSAYEDRPTVAFLPNVDPTVTRESSKWLIVHDERAVNKRSRQHEQQVATLLNGLRKNGVLTGPLDDPAIAADVDPLATTATLADVIAKVNELLATLGS